MAIVCHLAITLGDMKHFKADTPLSLFKQLSLFPHSVCCLHEDLHEREKLHIHLVKYIKLRNKKKMFLETCCLNCWLARQDLTVFLPRLKPLKVLKMLAML